MTPCPTTRAVLSRTGVLAVVFSTSFGLVVGLPGLASAQQSGPSTVRAVLDADGSVTDVDRLGSDEAAPVAADLPVTLAVAETASGPRTTTSYTVTNTAVQKKTLEYVGADGKTATVEQDVALPLVGQLSVRLPATRTGVNAFGARVTRLADGSTELVWSLILFSPLGSPTSEVGFRSSGTGEAVARLEVAAVQPASTPAFAATGQAASATLSSSSLGTMVANGATDGLVKLSDGVGQLLAGLDKLHAGAQKLNAGIVTAVDGAEQLADGSEKAHAGSDDLSTGLGKLSAGNASAADGAKKLSDGLAQISGGLDKLSAAQGLPAALDGAKKLQTGVDQLRAGLGAPDKDGTLLNGLAQVAGGLGATGTGLGQVKGGLDGLAGGLPAAKGGVDAVRGGLAGASADAGALDQLGQLVALGRAGVVGCAPGLPVAKPTTACEALNTVAFGLSHPAGTTGPTDAGGLKQQLAAAAAGLGQVSTGLGAAAAGVGQLQAGVTSLQAGNTALQAGVARIDGGAKQIAAGLASGDAAKPGVAEGLDALVAGLTAAVGGVGQLSAGAQAASTGSAALASGTEELAAGAAKAYTGSQDLRTGLGTIAAGQRKVADGLPAAADGSGQLADGVGQLIDGEQKVATGLGDIRTKAIDRLKSQFAQGIDSASQQIAAVAAAGAMVADTPGAAATTWVLTQSDGGISTELVSSESDLARNAAIGVGGALLLMTGIAGGYVSGRRKTLV